MASVESSQSRWFDQFIRISSTVSNKLGLGTDNYDDATQLDTSIGATMIDWLPTEIEVQFSPMETFDSGILSENANEKRDGESGQNVQEDFKRFGIDIRTYPQHYSTQSRKDEQSAPKLPTKNNKVNVRRERPDDSLATVLSLTVSNTVSSRSSHTSSYASSQSSFSDRFSGLPRKVSLICQTSEESSEYPPLHNKKRHSFYSSDDSNQYQLQYDSTIPLSSCDSSFSRRILRKTMNKTESITVVEPTVVEPTVVEPTVVNKPIDPPEDNIYHSRSMESRDDDDVVEETTRIETELVDERWDDNSILEVSSTLSEELIRQVLAVSQDEEEYSEINYETGVNEIPQSMGEIVESYQSCESDISAEMQNKAIYKIETVELPISPMTVSYLVCNDNLEMQQKLSMMRIQLAKFQQSIQRHSDSIKLSNNNLQQNLCKIDPPSNNNENIFDTSSIIESNNINRINEDGTLEDNSISSLKERLVQKHDFLRNNFSEQQQTNEKSELSHEMLPEISQVSPNLVTNNHDQNNIQQENQIPDKKNVDLKNESEINDHDQIEIILTRKGLTKQNSSILIVKNSKTDSNDSISTPEPKMSNRSSSPSFKSPIPGALADLKKGHSRLPIKPVFINLNNNKKKKDILTPREPFVLKTLSSLSKSLPSSPIVKLQNDLLQHDSIESKQVLLESPSSRRNNILNNKVEREFSEIMMSQRKQAARFTMLHIRQYDPTKSNNNLNKSIVSKDRILDSKDTSSAEIDVDKDCSNHIDCISVTRSEAKQVTNQDFRHAEPCEPMISNNLGMSPISEESSFDTKQTMSSVGMDSPCKLPDCKLLRDSEKFSDMKPFVSQGCHHVERCEQTSNNSNILSASKECLLSHKPTSAADTGIDKNPSNYPESDLVHVPDTCTDVKQFANLSPMSEEAIFDTKPTSFFDIGNDKNTSNHPESDLILFSDKRSDVKQLTSQDSCHVIKCAPMRNNNSDASTISEEYISECKFTSSADMDNDKGPSNLPKSKLLYYSGARTLGELSVDVQSSSQGTDRDTDCNYLYSESTSAKFSKRKNITPTPHPFVTIPREDSAFEKVLSKKNDKRNTSFSQCPISPLPHPLLELNQKRQLSNSSQFSINNIHLKDKNTVTSVKNAMKPLDIDHSSKTDPPGIPASNDTTDETIVHSSLTSSESRSKEIQDERLCITDGNLVATLDNLHDLLDVGIEMIKKEEQNMLTVLDVKPTTYKRTSTPPTRTSSPRTVISPSSRSLFRNKSFRNAARFSTPPRATNETSTKPQIVTQSNILHCNKNSVARSKSECHLNELSSMVIVTSSSDVGMSLLDTNTKFVFDCETPKPLNEEVTSLQKKIANITRHDNRENNVGSVKKNSNRSFTTKEQTLPQKSVDARSPPRLLNEEVTLSQKSESIGKDINRTNQLKLPQNNRKSRLRSRRTLRTVVATTLKCARQEFKQQLKENSIIRTSDDIAVDGKEDAKTTTTLTQSAILSVDPPAVVDVPLMIELKNTMNDVPWQSNSSHNKKRRSTPLPEIISVNHPDNDTGIINSPLIENATIRKQNDTDITKTKVQSCAKIGSLHRTQLVKGSGQTTTATKNKNTSVDVVGLEHSTNTASSSFINNGSSNDHQSPQHFLNKEDSIRDFFDKLNDAWNLNDDNSSHFTNAYYDSNQTRFVCDKIHNDTTQTTNCSEGEENTQLLSSVVASSSDYDDMTFVLVGKDTISDYFTRIFNNRHKYIKFSNSNTYHKASITMHRRPITITEISEMDSIIFGRYESEMIQGYKKHYGVFTIHLRRQACGNNEQHEWKILSEHVSGSYFAGIDYFLSRQKDLEASGKSVIP